jgi:hypothetical protein
MSLVEKWFLGSKIDYDQNSDTYFPFNQERNAYEYFTMVSGPVMVWYSREDGVFDMTQNMYMVEYGKVKKFKKPTNDNVTAKYSPFLEGEPIIWTPLTFDRSETLAPENAMKRRKQPYLYNFSIVEIMLGFSDTENHKVLSIKTYVLIDFNAHMIKKLYGITNSARNQKLDYVMNIPLQKMTGKGNACKVQIKSKTLDSNMVKETNATVQIIQTIPFDQTSKEWIAKRKEQVIIEENFIVINYENIHGEEKPAVAIL